jgi:hypothetical protein
LKKLLIICSFFLVMIQCGCIEIVEKITVNADRSGRAEFAIDLEMLGSLATSTAGNYIDLSFMDQIKSFPATYGSKIKNTSGISNIRAISDDKNGLYSIAFDFKNPAALNRTIYTFLDRPESLLKPRPIKIRRHYFHQRNFAPLIRHFYKQYQSKIKDESIFKYIDYVSVFVLPKDVRSISNTKSLLKRDGKTITFKTSLNDLLTTDINVGNRINY